VELEKNYTISSRPGVIRLLGFVNNAHMGSYRETIDTPALGMDVTLSRQYRSKYGCGLNFEQQITDDVGFFGRAGWSDGHTETWAFTEIDDTLSLGVSFKGTGWGRKDDVFGLAGVSNGLSRDHRDYLAAGGYGFIVGDGRLNYGREDIMETYYAATLLKGITISLDCQLITHPAYNRDRGPVWVNGFRIHASY
jgi:high affinity Mn2+ porin